MSNLTDSPEYPSGRKKRILEVCTVPTEKSGIPNVAFNLMRGMDKEAFEIGYVAINEPEEFYRNELDRIGAKLYVIPRKLSAPLSYVMQLAKIARGYDIIHVHGNSATMVLEMLAAAMAGVRIRAAHSHSTSCRMRKIDACSRPFFYALCNKRLACGVEAGRWLFGKRKFEVIKNGIDTEKFRFDSARRDSLRKTLAPGNEILLGNIANFNDVKNHAFLLDVFREVVNNNPAFRLVLLGEGELMDETKAKAAALGLEDKVVFAGSVDNPESYMSALDCIVMPSKYEGLPLTLVEEQANGLSAIVSTAVPREVNITGNLRFLPLEAGPAAWADEILKNISKLKHDAEVSEESIGKIRKAGFDIASSADYLSRILA